MAFWERVGHYLDTGYESSRTAFVKAKDYGKIGSLLVEKRGYESKRNQLTQSLGNIVYPILASGNDAIVKTNDKDVEPILKEIHDMDLLIMKKTAEVEEQRRIIAEKAHKNI